MIDVDEMEGEEWNRWTLLERAVLDRMRKTGLASLRCDVLDCDKLEPRFRPAAIITRVGTKSIITIIDHLMKAFVQLSTGERLTIEKQLKGSESAHQAMIYLLDKEVEE